MNGHERHDLIAATDRRRRRPLTTPGGETIVVYSATCAVGWLCRSGLPADIETARPESEPAA